MTERGPGGSPEADFDAHAETYRSAVERSISFSGREHAYFARRKADYLVALTERHVGDPGACSVLDAGCGVGVMEEFLVPRVGRVHGVDIAGDAVARAAADHPAATFSAYDGEVLPFADDAFDVAFAACVLHHIEPADRPSFVRELRRVVRPGGIVVVFEHNPFNPLTRFAVGRCEFDEGVELLKRGAAEALLRGAGLNHAESAYIITHTFSGRPWYALERRLGRLPLGTQYYAASRTPPA